MDDTVIVDELSKVGIRVYSEEDILKLSVKELTNPQLPTIGGWYNPDLGSTSNEEGCTTCGQSGRDCPGHMGYIGLALPVFNPIFFKMFFRLLKGVCLSCQSLYMMRVEGELFVQQMRMLDRGCVQASRELHKFFYSRNILLLTLEELATEAEAILQDASTNATSNSKMVEAEMSELMDDVLHKHFSTAPKVCQHCQCLTGEITHQYYSRIIFQGSCSKLPSTKQLKPEGNLLPEPPPPEAPDLVEEAESAEREEIVRLLKDGKGQCLILPHLARQILRKVWGKDGPFLRSLLRCLGEIPDVEFPTDMFFLSAILVPPSLLRPLSVMGGNKFENLQKAILKDNYDIPQLLKKIVRAARKQMLTESPLHDLTDSELDDDCIEDCRLKNPIDGSDCDGYDSTGTTSDIKPFPASLRTIQMPAKRVGQPRKSPEPAPVTQGTPYTPPDISDHDYSGPHPALLRPRFFRIMSTEPFAAPNQAPASNRSNETVTGTQRLVIVVRKPTKGGRKSNGRVAVRDPLMKEKHRIAEKNRRLVRNQLFNRLVMVIVTVKPFAYLEFKNKKSKKNNLTIALHLLENQVSEIRKRCNTLVRRLRILCQLLGARAQESPRSSKMQQDLKQVRQLIAEVNKHRTKMS